MKSRTTGGGDERLECWFAACEGGRHRVQPHDDNHILTGIGALEGLGDY